MLNAKLGEILVEKGFITREQLDMALREQKSRGIDQKRIGGCLVDLGFASEDDITQALAAQFNMPILRLEGVQISVANQYRHRIDLCPTIHSSCETTACLIRMACPPMRHHLLN